jgi:hypothetical protein
MLQEKVSKVKASKFKTGFIFIFIGNLVQFFILELVMEIYTLSKLYYDSVKTTKTFLTTRMKIWNTFRRTEQLEAQLWFRL